MPNITFIYQGDDYNIEREHIVKKLCDIISTLIDLPDELQVVFAMLGESVYGNTVVDPRFKNRITINTVLTNTEIAHVIVHELIHINQIKSGRLSVTSNGRYIWGGNEYIVSNNIDMNTYLRLPWELDVRSREKSILTKVLQILNT